LLVRKAEPEILLSQRKIELASLEIVRRYIEDLRQFINSSNLPERRASIKSFVKEIKVTGEEGRIMYTFPIPPDNQAEGKMGVLYIVRYGGRYCTVGRTFKLAFNLDY
jgi:hypothetical protein